MKRIFAGVLLLITAGPCFAQKAGSAYTISGDIKGMLTDTAYLSMESAGKVRHTDTAVIRDGKFNFTGTVNQPLYSFATIGHGKGRWGFGLFVEQGKTEIRGDLAVSNEVRVTGTPANNDLDAFSQSELVVYAKMRQQRKAFAELKKNQDSLAAKKTGEQEDSVETALHQEVMSIRTGFIRKHPHSPASAVALYLVSNDVSWQELDTLYHTLSANVQQSLFSEGILATIEAGKRTDINRMAPAFTLDDPDGNRVNISSFKGKYVLIDFWASWCVPCREENQRVLPLYDKYRQKNFVILGISVDKNTDKWKEAILKDRLPWTNVCDKGKGGPSVAKLYGVQPIPDNFLIDPDGKIIGRKLFGKELDDKLKNVLH